MKVAIAGKGSVGKTTAAAILSTLLVREGKDVVAIDADSAGNLATALGIPRDVRSRIVPLLKMHGLIHERAGVRPGSQYGSLFRLNPPVDDIEDRYSVVSERGVKLLVLGTIEHAEAGCFCPAHAFLKALLMHEVIKKEHIVVDLEAGIEHLGRGTTKHMDVLAVVVEPSLRSIEAAGEIKGMAGELGVPNLVAVLNKVRDEREVELVRERIDPLGIPLVGVLPFDERVLEADIEGGGIFDAAESSPDRPRAIQAHAPIFRQVGAGILPYFHDHISSQLDSLTMNGCTSPVADKSLGIANWDKRGPIGSFPRFSDISLLQTNVAFAGT